MKKILPALILCLIVGLILGATAMWLHTLKVIVPTPVGASLATPSAPSSADTPATATAATAAPAAPEKPNPLRLNAAKRAAAGITLVKSAPATITPQVEGYARVLDTTPLISMAADVEAARISLDASQKDLDRTQKLYDAGGNASAAQLQAAQAALARDTATVKAAYAKLLAAWGRDITEDVFSLIASLQKGATLIRIDYLPGDAPAPAAKQARLTPVGASLAAPSAIRNQTGVASNAPTPSTADIIGAAPVADPQLLGVSFVAIVRDTTTPLPVGAQLRATLPGRGETTTAPAIPRSAIVYYQGSAWIYVLGEEDTFERKLVTLGRLLPDDRVAITTGLDDPDDQIAATGAQQLLSAELQAGDTGDSD